MYESVFNVSESVFLCVCLSVYLCVCERVYVCVYESVCEHVCVFSVHASVILFFKDLFICYM